MLRQSSLGVDETARKSWKQFLMKTIEIDLFLLFDLNTVQFIEIPDTYSVFFLNVYKGHFFPVFFGVNVYKACQKGVFFYQQHLSTTVFFSRPSLYSPSKSCFFFTSKSIQSIKILFFFHVQVNKIPFFFFPARQ